MLKLAPYFQVRLDDPLCCDLLLDGRRVELRDPRYVQLLSGLHGEAPQSEVVRRTAEIFGISADEARTLVRDLVREQVLVAHDQVEPRQAAIEHWEQRGWLDALGLHCRSRDIAFDDDDPADLGRRHDELFSLLTRREAPPPFWKEYPQEPRVALPPGEPLPADRSFEEVLLSRRSNRRWSSDSLSLDRLGTILRSANRETLRLRQLAESRWQSSPKTLLQSAFSAIETYVIAFAVDGLQPGIYHYDPRDASLWSIRSGLLRDEVASMCAGQQRPSQACCVFAMTAVFERYMYRYRHPRAYRTLLTNVAELAQKYILLSTAFGLSTFLTPLFFDEVADELLGVDGYQEALIEVVAIG